MNQIIEVKIIKRKINYIATSTLFPQCKGIGKSKAEALQKLSSSISSFISKMVNSSLSNVFSSNNYTQIMLDQTKETNEETDEETTYHIVGPYEADISKGMISTSSPIARAVIGKAMGESAEVQSPGGVKSYEIISINLFDLKKVNR